MDGQTERHNLKCGMKNWTPNLGKSRSSNLKKCEI